MTMMKNLGRHLLNAALLALLSTTFSACEDGEPWGENDYNNTYISTSKYEIEADDPDEIYQFYVYANDDTEWYVDTPYWVNLQSSRYGRGYGIVRFNVDEYSSSSYSSSYRYDYIRVRSENWYNKSCDVIVKQYPTSSAVSATMEYTEFSNGTDGDYWGINVTAPSSTNWTLSSSVTWVKFGNTSGRNFSSNSSVATYYGTGSKMVYVYVPKNTTYGTRYGYIYLKSGSRTIQTISISQTK